MINFIPLQKSLPTKSDGQLLTSEHEGGWGMYVDGFGINDVSTFSFLPLFGQYLSQQNVDGFL